MSTKKIKKIVHLTEGNQGFKATMLDEQLGNIDPYIQLTNFWMPKAFFPPHPHAGFSVMTYMFLDSEGAFINRDSHGDRSRIEAGTLHLTQAGKGMLHEEIPEIEGQMCHGLQMWLNHASKDRFAEPESFHVDNNDMPEVSEHNVLVRILVGEYKEVKASFKPIPEINFYDVHLQPGGVFECNVPKDHISFIMMIEGEAMFEDTKVQKGSCIKFTEEGDTIEIKSANINSNFLMATGKPIYEEILFGGPFVMTTEEQMRQTKLSYGKGEMGQLKASSIFK